jgi:tetratricopeptide (TPR) repeat protein
MSQNNIFMAIFVGILILTGVVHFFTGSAPEDTEVKENTDESNPIIDGTENMVDPEDSIENEDTDDIGELPDGFVIPDLDRPITIREGLLLPKIEESTRSRIIALQDNLMDNPKSFSEWLELGSLRKLIEDYESARDAWETASIFAPENSLSYLNLGDLYGYFLKDNVNAEKNFLTAIDNNVEKITFPYVKTQQFYLDIGEPEKAKDIIKEGLIVIPGNEELTNILSELESS